MMPMLIRCRVRSPEHRFGFFIPLIVVYLLLLLPLLIVLTVYVVLTLFPKQTAEARAVLRGILYIPNLLRSCRGTEIVVHSDDTEVILYIS